GVKLTANRPSDERLAKLVTGPEPTPKPAEPQVIQPQSPPEVTQPTNPAGPKGLWARLRGRWGKSE
ncbi:MAG TPA: hypothetical protein PLY80_14350, partial [Pseudomonadota bacterium]|nr:hypothetical protein [Pseudomonadota bacterium]